MKYVQGPNMFRRRFDFPPQKSEIPSQVYSFINRWPEMKECHHGPLGGNLSAAGSNSSVV